MAIPSKNSATCVPTQRPVSKSTATRLQRNLVTLKNAGPVSKSGILGKILGTLSYLDIALVTFRIGSKALRAMRLLKRK